MQDFTKGRVWHRLHDLHTAKWLAESVIAAVAMVGPWLPFIRSHIGAMLAIVTNAVFVCVAFVFFRWSRTQADGARTMNASFEELGKIAFNYLPDSPLNHGWRLLEEVRVSSKPRFTAVPHEVPVPGGLSIAPTGWYGINYDLDQYAMRCDRLRFTANFGSDGRLYARVRVTSRDGRTVAKEKWLQHAPVGGYVAERTADECVVSISGKYAGNGWTAYDLSLADEVHACFSADGFVFRQLLSIRLRGTLSISAIELWRSVV